MDAPGGAAISRDEDLIADAFLTVAVGAAAGLRARRFAEEALPIFRRGDRSGTVHVGDKVGSVTLKQDGTKIAVMDLVADEESAGPNPIEWLLVKLDRLGRRIDNRPLTAESETVAKAPEV